MLHDKAFDAGLITISEDMTVCASRKHGGKSDTFYTLILRVYGGQLIEIPEKFVSITELLAYHRKTVFERG